MTTLPKGYSLQEYKGEWTWVHNKTGETGPVYRDKEKAIINAYVNKEQLELDRLNSLEYNNHSTEEGTEKE